MDTSESTTKESKELLQKATVAAEAMLGKAAEVAEALFNNATTTANILRCTSAENVEGMRVNSTEAVDVLLRGASKAVEVIRSESAVAAQLLLRTAAEVGETDEADEKTKLLLKEAAESARALLYKAAETAKALIAEAAVKAVKLLDDTALDGELFRRNAVKVHLVALRKKAEEALIGITAEADTIMQEVDAKRLVHELQLQKLELEMQNQELQNSSAEVDRLQEYFSNFYDCSPTGFVSFDRNGKIDNGNIACAELLGCERSKLTGALFNFFVDMADHLVFNTFLQHVFESGTKQTCLLSLGGKDQTRSFVQIMGTISPDKQSCRAVLVDLTESKRVENTLKENIIQNESLLQSIPFPLSIVDENGYIIFMSSLMEQTFGRPTGDEYCWNLYKDDQQQCENCPLNEPLQVGKTSTIEASGVRGGKLYTIYQTGMIYQGKQAFLEVFIDITEHRHLEEQLRQSQKMDAVGQLAGGVAHDFNNTLTVIMGYANLLQMDSGLTDHQKEEVEQILSSSEKAAQLTHGLLAFSRKQPMILRNSNLNDIVLHVEKFLTRIIGDDIKLTSTRHIQQLRVNVDSGQIEQVLINLATNARDAMQNCGSLTIETGMQEVGASFEGEHGYGEPGRYACITVSDTGSGMDEETSSKIFEPFFTTKEVGKGTGLGLSIAYGIVKQHNGFINVYSEQGHGTSFRVYLPLVESGLPELEVKVALPPPQGGTEAILVAEDNADVRKLVATVLTTFGYDVIQAVDGQEAVDMFAAHQDRIHLILMDMIMPKKNGKEAYEEICRTYTLNSRLIVTRQVRQTP